MKRDGACLAPGLGFQRKRSPVDAFRLIVPRRQLAGSLSGWNPGNARRCSTFVPNTVIACDCAIDVIAINEINKAL
jgi:D-arabinose 1-dehydrogenase-like Zn-dependent alcohol dehydrogenase